MLAKPDDSQSSLVKNEGALLINRTDTVAFRENFLALYAKNLFRKTFVSEFLILQKPIIFDGKGSQLDDKWYLHNRDRMSETDPSKIPILMPEEWFLDAKALSRYFERLRRREITQPSTPQMRNPTIGSIRDGQNNSKPTNNFSPFGSQVAKEQIIIEEPIRYQVVNKFNDPQYQGDLSFEKEPRK